jgi:hypothetical protein
MENVTAFGFTADVTVTAGGRPLEMGLDGAVDTEDRKLRMDLNFLGQSITQYIVNDTVYQQTQGRWVRQPTTGMTGTTSVWENPSGYAQPTNMDGADLLNLELQGTETVNGTEVYVITADPDPENVTELVLQQLDGAAETEGANVSQTQVDQIRSTLEDVEFENVEMTQYVRTGDYRLHGLDVNVSVAAGQTYDVSASMRVDDYDDVTITLPEAAQNAPTVNATGMGAAARP